MPFASYIVYTGANRFARTGRLSLCIHPLKEARTSSALPQLYRPSVHGPERQGGPASANITGASGLTSRSMAPAISLISHWALMQHR